VLELPCENRIRVDHGPVPSPVLYSDREKPFLAES